MWVSGSHLVHVYVVIMRRVVNGFEETLNLSRSSSVDHEDKCYPHWVQRKILGRVLVPLDVDVGFSCGTTRK